ncbi:hypothetical protein QBC40DRAFT_317662 [Triangularia verruculosa]|uniref:Protein kinase domain-containing protein n=1 Tax=Triangularia verruculosa TaxID=2587418 RepID=A0AAN6X6N6_9PEZI|nr:hypothetical protein QBC40DRAFT_317662 [Triangularia verruculosa]
MAPLPESTTGPGPAGVAHTPTNSPDQDITMEEGDLEALRNSLEDALRALTGYGVEYTDMKTDNFLLTDDGRATVVDLEQAELDRANVWEGSTNNANVEHLMYQLREPRRLALPRPPRARPAAHPQSLAAQPRKPGSSMYVAEDEYFKVEDIRDWQNPMIRNCWMTSKAVSFKYDRSIAANSGVEAASLKAVSLKAVSLKAQARSSLPPSLAWRPLAQSITCSAQVILQRIWLDVYLLRLQIILHKRHCFTPARQGEPEPYPYSEQACLTAAIKILEYQGLVDDETQSPDGQLYQVRWKLSSLFNYHFLLATSILCSLFRGDRGSNQASGSNTLQLVGGHDKIRQLLTRSLDVWMRSSSSSHEAKKAARALRLILRGADTSMSLVSDASFSETSRSPSMIPPTGFDWSADPTLSTSFMSNMGFPFALLPSMQVDTDISGFVNANAPVFDLHGEHDYFEAWQMGR